MFVLIHIFVRQELVSLCEYLYKIYFILIIKMQVELDLFESLRSWDLTMACWFTQINVIAAYTFKVLKQS